MEYRIFLKACLVDGTVDPSERKALSELRSKNGITDNKHKEILKELDWTLEDFEAIVKEGEVSGIDEYDGFIKNGLIDKELNETEKRNSPKLEKQQVW